MIKNLIRCSITIFLLAVAVLLCQQASARHVRNNSSHRRQTASCAIDDESTTVNRAKAWLLSQRAHVSSEPGFVDLHHPAVPVRNARDLMLSRGVQTTFSLHLLDAQTHSSAT